RAIQSELERVAAPGPHVGPRRFDSVELAVGAEARAAQRIARLQAHAGMRYVRIVQRIDAECRVRSPGVEVDVRDRRVADLDPRMARAAEHADAGLAPAPELAADVERGLGAADAEAGDTLAVGERVEIGLLQVDTRRDEPARVVAHRLVELRGEQRLRAELHVRAPFGTERVDADARVPPGHVERRKPFEVVLDGHAELQDVRAPALRPGVKLDTLLTVLPDEAIADLR